MSDDKPATDSVEEDVGPPLAGDERFRLALEGYEGTLDLLPGLARDRKVDLARLSILALAEQCLAFVERARGLSGGIAVNRDGRRRSAFDLLAYPEIDLKRLAGLWPELAGLAPEIAGQIETEARYAGYLARQEADIRALRRDEALALPENLDYDRVGGLSNEARQILATARPATLGAAA
ncbi:MAG: hypothetical protein GDA47_01995, partial [Rhodospirillales bacterium]|nr:hypothetical protein [Rhodospirillales bacterium]